MLYPSLMKHRHNDDLEERVTDGKKSPLNMDKSEIYIILFLFLFIYLLKKKHSIRLLLHVNFK